MNWNTNLYWLLILAGAGQAILCLASPAIPVVLGWREKLAALPKLMRQVYWTYACYILGAHVCFAVLSLAAPRWLLQGDGLAAAVSGFIALWWGVRFALHLTSFDTAEVPEGGWYRAAEWGLGLLFGGLTTVYVLVLAFNLGGLR
jgi:hypothetical protein